MKNLAAALIKAQIEMDPLRKDGKNPHLNSKYSTLSGVQDACLPALGKHDIAVFQSVSVDWSEAGAMVKVGCTMFHAPSGEFILNELPLRPIKSDPQGIGSAITYGRRYLLMTMTGLAPEDDDGNEASGTAAKQAQKQAPKVQHRHVVEQEPAPNIDNPPEISQDGDGDRPPRASQAQRNRLHALGTEIYADDWDEIRHDMVKTITTGQTTSSNDLTPNECARLITRMEFNKLGRTLYGDQWPQVSRHNIERITGGSGSEPLALTDDQMDKLMEGMKKLQAKRTQAPAVAAA